MESRVRVLVTMVALFLFITSLYLFTDWFSKTTGYVLGEDQQLRFVQCLNSKGAVLYTQDKCSDCFKQEQLFTKSAYASLVIVSCDSVSCESIQSVPAWAIEGTFYYGFKDFRALSEYSGCDLELEQ